jgi:hypothetical protein
VKVKHPGAKPRARKSYVAFKEDTAGTSGKLR